jgi:hypothetical protein
LFPHQEFNETIANPIIEASCCLPATPLAV